MLFAIRAILLLHFMKFVQSIECKSSCHTTVESVMLDDGTSLNCEIKRSFGDSAISQNRTFPAPRPTNLIVAWEERKQRQISLSITWEQKKNHITDEMVTGHDIIFTLDERPITYLVHITKIHMSASPGRLSSHVNKSPYIQFKFTCFGRDGRVSLRPTDKLQVAVKSLPLPRISGMDQVIQTEFEIPGIKAIQERREENVTGLAKDVNKAKPETTKKSTATVQAHKIGAIFLIVITFILVCLMVTACIIGRKNGSISGKPTHRQRHQKQKIIIAITNTEENLSELHSCMENLRRKLGVSIASNWTNGNTILKIGLWKWFQNNLNNQLTDAILVLIDFKTDNATIPTDWELIISSYTRFHKKQELIYLHKGSDSLNRQIRKNPRIITFAYKTDYDENDDLYRHLQQLTSQPVNEDSRMESEVTV